MNWSYVFGKNMTVTDQHKKYWHIESYETDETLEKGYIVDSLDITKPSESSFLKRNPTHGVGTLETATFDWGNATVAIKRYEEVYKLKAPVIELNGSSTSQYTLKITNPNDPLAPTLAPIATFKCQNLGETTYDIKPGESLILDNSWNLDPDDPESVTWQGYFSAFHCTDSDVVSFTVKKEVIPNDLICSCIMYLDQTTGAFKQVQYSITNINDYAIIFQGTLKEDDTVLKENFEIGAQATITGTVETDGFQLTLDGVLKAKEE